MQCVAGGANVCAVCTGGRRSKKSAFRAYISDGPYEAVLDHAFTFTFIYLWVIPLFFFFCVIHRLSAMANFKIRALLPKLIFFCG